MFNLKNLKYLNNDTKIYGGAALFSVEDISRQKVEEVEETNLSNDILLYNPEEYLPIINQRLTERGHNEIDNINNLDQAFQILFPIHYAMLEGERERVRNLGVLPPVVNVNINNNNGLAPPVYRRQITHRKKKYVHMVYHVLNHGESSADSAYNLLILIPLNQELNQLNQRIATESADLQVEGYPVQRSIIGARRILDEIQQRRIERAVLEQGNRDANSNIGILPSDETHANLVKEFLGGNSDNLFYKQKYVKYKAKYLELARLLNK